MVDQGKKWKISTDALENLLSTHLDVDDEKEAYEHVNGLIDCINELTRERQSSVDQLEETTIKVAVARRKYNSIKTNAAEELKYAISSAHEQNEDYIKKLNKITTDIHNELEDVHKHIFSLKHENEVLFGRSEEAKRMWPELCRIVCDTMKKKAQMQIKVNETRCKTVEAYHRTNALTDDAHDLTLEIEKYWKIFREKANKINAEAEQWKEKINEQDEETAEAKSKLDDFQQEIRWSQSRNFKANETLENEKKKYQQLLSQTISLKGKLAGQGRLQENEKLEIRNIHLEMHHAKEEHELKKAEIAALQNGALEESVMAHREKEILSIEKQTKHSKAEKLRFRLRESRDKHRRHRTVLLEVNNLANMVMADQTAARHERLKLKETLSTVGGNREQMERRYEKELVKLTEDLEIHEKLKEETQKQYFASLRNLERWSNEMFEYFEESNTAIEECKRRNFGYVAEAKVLKKENEDLQIQEAGLQLSMVEGKRRTEAMKTSLTDTVKVLKESINVNKELVKELNAKKTLLLPQYTVVSTQFEETSSRYKKMRDNLVLKNREVKDLRDAIESCRFRLSELTEARSQMKANLNSVNRALLWQIVESRRDTRSVSQKIYQILQIREALQQQNESFGVKCKEIQKIMKHESDELDCFGQLVTIHGIKLDQIQFDMHMNMENEARLRGDANKRDEEILSSIAVIKDLSKMRGNQLGETWEKMDDLIELFSPMDNQEELTKTPHKTKSTRNQNKKKSSGISVHLCF